MTVQTEDVLTSWSLDTDNMQSQLAKMKNNLGNVEEKFSKASAATVAFGTAMGNVAVAAVDALIDKMGQLSKIAIDYEDDVGDNVKALEGMRSASGGLISNLDLMHARMRLQNGDLQLSEEQLTAVTKAAMQYSRVNNVEFGQSLDTITNAIERGTARSVRGLGIAFNETGTRAQKQAKMLEAISKNFSGLQFEAENTNERLMVLSASFDNIVGSIGSAILQTETFQNLIKGLVSDAKEIDEYFSKSGERREFESLALRARELRQELSNPLPENSFLRWLEEKARGPLQNELKEIEKRLAIARMEMADGQKQYEKMMGFATGEKDDFVFSPSEGATLTLEKNKRAKKWKLYTEEDLKWKQINEQNELDHFNKLQDIQKNYDDFVAGEKAYALRQDAIDLSIKEEKEIDKLIKKKAALKNEQEMLTASYKELAEKGVGTAIGALNQFAAASIFAGDSAGDAAKAMLSSLAGALAQEAQMQAMKQLALAFGNPAMAPTHLASMAAWEALALSAGGLGAAVSRSSNRASQPVADTSNGSYSSASPVYRAPAADSMQKEQVINVYFGNPESPVANLIATKKITAMRA